MEKESRQENAKTALTPTAFSIRFCIRWMTPLRLLKNALQGTQPSAAQSMISASRDGCVTPVLHDALLRLFEINTDNTTMQRAKPTTLNPIPFHRWFAKILDAKDLQGWKDILGKTATGTNVMDSDDCIDIGDCSNIRAMYTLVITSLHFRTLASKALACET